MRARPGDPDVDRGRRQGATTGVLIKNAEALERMEKIDTLVVDKTGTLTEGKPRVIAGAAAGFDETEILALAASLERSSSPLATAIVTAARERGVPLQDASAFQSLTGKGVTGCCRPIVALGNRHCSAGRHRYR
jgi:Cu+-exporting ATPase